jgi:hypothetical protein
VALESNSCGQATTRKFGTGLTRWGHRLGGASAEFARPAPGWVGVDRSRRGSAFGLDRSDLAEVAQSQSGELRRSLPWR